MNEDASSYDHHSTFSLITCGWSEIVWLTSDNHKITSGPEKVELKLANRRRISGRPRVMPKSCSPRSGSVRGEFITYNKKGDLKVVPYPSCGSTDSALEIVYGS